MNPPFLFFLKKRNGPFTVQREIAWADKSPVRVICGQYGGIPNRCGGDFPPSAECAGQSCLKKCSAASWKLGYKTVVVIRRPSFWPRAFRFATHYPSAYPGVESKGGGRSPLLCVVRGCGGEIETPPRFWWGSKGEVSLRQRHLPLASRMAKPCILSVPRRSAVAPWTKK